ncbi:MAG: GNAT family N-acetyltransferase [Chloroflexi bacterium]|nr:GNAT family N-acetyltransferase [Chloroflexota bacterium]MCI0578942.1 GNAT family N-acetyltransferase [Chloroflexota bacterium]MCI0646879.1 GNAT family N-acetyltransferase [Chloroflexota bacterium]MCI0730803.1 GNAT family N-acetyltransferase [Chloroflexota bacterium]
MSITIRPAVEADQPTIVALVRQARINPRNLHWSRFLVVEDSGKIVGMRQVKVHKGGTREVASGFVRPEYRRQGLSAQLMNEILARESGPLYLLCDKKWSPYYEQFGFRHVAIADLPADFRREYRIARTITGLMSLFSSRKVHVISMKREGWEGGRGVNELSNSTI